MNAITRARMMRDYRAERHLYLVEEDRHSVGGASTALATTASTGTQASYAELAAVSAPAAIAVGLFAKVTGATLFGALGAGAITLAALMYTLTVGEAAVLAQGVTA